MYVIILDTDPRCVGCNTTFTAKARPAGDEFKESEAEAKLILSGSPESESEQRAPNQPIQVDEGPKGS